MRRALIAAVAVAAILPYASAAAKKYDTSFKGFKDGVLNVHIVPHTHDDVGWLKTVDEYFMGANDTIQHAGVQYILDSVLLALRANPDRKFIYVEQAFFQRWWAQQDTTTQAEMQQYVANGQLEFVNGGWCMHDEASPGVIDMIDQTTLGHRLIKGQFGVVPSSTWQIDPFGHSATQSSLLTAASGFQSLYFARIDYENKAMRVNTSTLEFIWRSSPNLGVAAQSFTGVLYSGYGPIDDSFCYDQSCDSAIPIQDDETLEDYNVDERVATFVKLVLEQGSHYLGGHIMLTMGSDFQYENANTWYKNLDKLIHYVNTMAGGQINVFYSTPSIYTSAKLSQNISWPVVTDDQFPYRDNPHSPWTGYFTSRPAVKGYVRESSSLMQAMRQLQTLTGGAVDLGPSNPLYMLERAMGVAQHHDAVSGTEKQHVAYDYAKRVSIGRATAEPLVANALMTLTGYTGGEFVPCDLTNVTICPALEAGQQQVVLIYNPQSTSQAAMPIRIAAGFPTGVASYNVYDPTGNLVVAQVTPLSAQDGALRTMYNGNPVNVQWLHFVASVPAVGYSAYFIVPSSTEADAPVTHISRPLRMRPGLRGVGDQTLTNGVLSLTISGATGMVSNFVNMANGLSLPLSQQYVWYNASVGNAESSQASGAYIFRPNASTPFPVGASAATVDIITGPIVNEARQTIADYASQVVRLWSNASYAEFEWTVGHIPTNEGHEVVTQYVTKLQTNATWWTDSNGREMRKRIRFFRPQWNLTVTEPVSGEYYPVNFAIKTSDSQTGLTLGIAVDRSQGGSSIMDGELELMVHRRLQVDDSRGVGEPLNETGVDGLGLTVRGVHRVFVDMPTTAARSLKTNQMDLTLRPVVRFAPFTGTPAQWIANYIARYSGLTADLPRNVMLMTAHSQGPSQLLLRLAHSYEIGEDPVLSQNVTVSLSNMFAGLGITAVTELDLVASRVLSDMPRFTLRGTDGSVTEHPVLPEPVSGDDFAVTLNPMQIRTFLVTTTPQ